MPRKYVETAQIEISKLPPPPREKLENEEKLLGTLSHSFEIVRFHSKRMREISSECL